MDFEPVTTYSAFSGSRLLVAGALDEVAVAARRLRDTSDASLLVFSDANGDQIDLDLRGSEDDVRSRYQAAAGGPPEATAPRGRGRPKLGVVSREVTLLPEQWDWLAAQPGGASVALRKLVQAARRAGTARERLRRAQERSYKVMVALAGNEPGFEEASRALFADDRPALRRHCEAWPPDVRDHVLRLADAEGITSPDEPS